MPSYGIDIRSLTERVADKIEELITENQLRPGEQIPPERELAEELGVGRSTVRESIKILVSRNVLEIRRGTGTFVCQDVGVMEDPLGFRFIRDKKKLALDLNQVRRMVEPQIASLAAQYATDSDITALQALCDSAARQIEEEQDYAEQDIGFHTKLAEITGNLVMPKIIPIITQGIRIYVDITSHKRAGRASFTHQAIVTAIKNHDPGAAGAAMTEHLAENRETLESLTIW